MPQLMVEMGIGMAIVYNISGFCCFFPESV